jgi:hypothetical protein
LISAEDDISTVSTIATVWATTRYELLAAKAHDSISATPGGYDDLNTVNHLPII